MHLLRDRQLNINRETVQLHRYAYSNQRHALQLVSQNEDGYFEPYMTCSVNLPDAPCPPDEVFIKDWSENEGITEWLVKNQVILPESTGCERTGYVVAFRYKLHPDIVADLKKELE